jgi:hypothetical protein
MIFFKAIGHFFCVRSPPMWRSALSICATLLDSERERPGSNHSGEFLFLPDHSESGNF